MEGRGMVRWLAINKIATWMDTISRSVPERRSNKLRGQTDYDHRHRYALFGNARFLHPIYIYIEIRTS